MAYNTRLVKEDAVIVKERLLPYPGEVYVTVGEAVNPDTLIAKTELLPGSPSYIDIVDHLEANTENVENVLLKQKGDTVKRDEALAKTGDQELKAPFNGVIEYVSLSNGYLLVRQEVKENDPPETIEVTSKMGVRPAALRHMLSVKVGDEVVRSQPLAGEVETIVAPIPGTITDISYDEGTITIQPHYQPTTVHSYAVGKVTEVKPNFGAIVETRGCLIQGVFGVGSEMYGQLQVVVDSPEAELSERMITEEHAGKIIVGGKNITFNALSKAIDVGVHGVIVGGAPSSHLVSTFGDKVALGVTGDDTQLALIATEGFGKVAMRPSTFALLQKYDNHMAVINGTTDIRSNITWPELIIFHQGEKLSNNHQQQEQQLAIEKGLPVRVLTMTNFGQCGEVVEVNASTNLYTIRLEDGNLIDLSEANIEML